ncbi:SsrA-binding protein [Aureibaculum sp. A20]|uniref:SsrA-binding protein n=1 Tax=Aureibaculum flavum TaxID=2795986 RepID=A0ABS0WW39_9FLAO|nr:SsrA-binding protein [Aureibaculum flavum]MBJ2176202.1 SsrA-binding protein [Aureibaculum flavum]
MKKHIFKIVAKLNKSLLPSLSKKEVYLSKASKMQLALIGWRYYITKNSLGS